MDHIFPFIYEPKKEKFEPLPLYIENYVPIKKNDEEKEEELNIIIIEM